MRWTIRLVFATLLALASTAGAIPPPWTPLGPFGGGVTSLTADPKVSGTLYAATLEGIFKTTDGGASWTLSSLEKPTSNVAADPVHPSTLYVGVTGAHVLLKSTDGGAHWAPAAQGLPHPEPQFHVTVAVDPSSPRRLLLVENGHIWRSTDAAASWQPVSNGLPTTFNPVVSVAFVARPAGTAFAPTTTGLYKTTDAGLSWKLVGGGLPADFFRVAVAPSDPRTLYAASAQLGLYRTTNGGASWQLVHGASDMFGAALFVAPTSPRTLYSFSFFSAPLFRSTDGGASWSAVSGIANVSALAFDPAAPQRLYAGVTTQPLRGVLRSDDGGASWTRSSQGLTALETPVLAVDPGDAERLWITAGPALYRSANGGTRWARANSPSTFPLNALAVGDSAALFAGVPILVLHGLMEYSTYKSPDDGASWKKVLDILQANERQILVAPSDLSTVYVQGVTPGDSLLQLYRSLDNGETWTQRSVPDDAVPFCGSDLAVAPSSATVLYLATGRFNTATSRCVRGVSRSVDGGATWVPADAGLPDLGVPALAVDRSDPDRVYAGTAGGGVWKSADGGQSWSQAGTVLAGQSIYVLLASTVPNRVYAAAGGRVFRSNDGGVTWQSWSHGLQTSFVFSLAASPADPGRIYAATSNGVWVLTETD